MALRPFVVRRHSLLLALAALAAAAACSSTEEGSPVDATPAVTPGSSDGGSGGGRPPGEQDSGVVDGLLPDGGVSFEDLGLRHKSGTRLSARFVKDGSGVRAFLGFRDNQRGEDCTLQGPSGGIVQCLPERKPTLDTSSYLFSNAACTARVAMDMAGGCAPKYAVLSQGGCNTNYEVFSLGAKLPSMTLYRNGTGPCELDNLLSPGANALYPVGAKVAPAEFVTFTRVVGPAANGISVAELRGADGSSSFESLVESASGVRCVVRTTTDGITRCVPVGASYTVGSYFADAACTSPAIRVPASCTPLKLSLETVAVPGSCAQQVRTRNLGAAMTAAYLKAGNTCSSVDSSQCPGCTSAGPEVAPASFVQLPRVTAAASRVRATTYLASPGLAMRTELYDTAKDDACEVTYAGDGTLRCVPGVEGIRFVDAACTIPAAINAGTVRTCGAKYVWMTDYTTCPSRRRVWTAGAEQNAVVYLKVRNSCVADGFATRVVPGTTEVPASELAAFSFE